MIKSERWTRQPPLLRFIRETTVAQSEAKRLRLRTERRRLLLKWLGWMMVTKAVDVQGAFEPSKGWRMDDVDVSAGHGWKCQKIWC
jgi:hypothetical protein